MSTLYQATPRRRSRASRIVAAACAIGTVGATAIALDAFAAFSGLPHETQFEIDGNTAVDGGQDWDSDPATATNLRDAPFATDDGCSVSDDPPDGDEDRIVQGSKIDGILIDAPPSNTGNVPGKTYLCLTYRTWELVFVPTPDPGDDPAAGQYESIFYAWSRPNVNGEIDVLFPLLGSDPTTNADDLIISYDFVDSTDQTTVDILAWDGDSWEPTAGLPAGSFERSASQCCSSNSVAAVTSSTDDRCPEPDSHIAPQDRALRGDRATSRTR